jgi:hypothetical protein
MKHLLCVLTVLLLLALAAPTGATITPTFEPAQAIYWGSGQVINVGNNGVIPNVGDWDMDGVKDLMVGVYQSGNIWYYHNTGTNANPIFPDRMMLTAGGSNISVTYG